MFFTVTRIRPSITFTGDTETPNAAPLETSPALLVKLYQGLGVKCTQAYCCKTKPNNIGSVSRVSFDVLRKKRPSVCGSRMRKKSFGSISNLKLPFQFKLGPTAR